MSQAILLKICGAAHNCCRAVGLVYLLLEDMAHNSDFWARGRSRSTNTPGEDPDYLRHRIEKLTLVNRALWEIIAKQHGYPKDMLVAEIDLRDGELDKELHEPVIHCPECGRKINARHHHCLYSGFDQLPEDVFTSV